MDKPTAFVALTTVRTKLRSIISEDIEAFSDVLALVKHAVLSSEHKDNQDDVLAHCNKANGILDDIEKRHHDAKTELPISQAECFEVVRNEIARAVKSLKSS